MAYKNSFTNGRIELNLTMSKQKMSTCLPHSTSLPRIHHLNLSIFEKMIFPLLEKIIAIIFSSFHVFLVLVGTTRFWFYTLLPLHFYCHFLAYVSFHPHQQKICTNSYNITILKKRSEQCFFFMLKFKCLNSKLVAKTVSWVWMNFFCPFRIVSSVWMKTHHDYPNTFYRIWH